MRWSLVIAVAFLVLVSFLTASLLVGRSSPRPAHATRPKPKPALHKPVAETPPPRRRRSNGGLHGTTLVATRALPSRRKLVSGTENTVTAGADLGFAVTVEDTGDSQEVQFGVTLTIQQSPTPIVQTKTIALINPGQRKTVTFRNLSQVQFATRTTVKVDVQPVPDEKTTANNWAAYPVVFSLG